MYPRARSLVVRGILALTACSLLPVSPSWASAPSPGEARGAAPRPERLIGVLTPQAYRRCDGTVASQWVHPHHEIGFVALVHKLKGLARYENLPVIALGAPADNWKRPDAGHTGPCIDAQMREDWVEGVHGTRVRRTGGVGFEAFDVRSVQPWSGLKLTRVGDAVEVTVRNDLDFDLRHLQVRLHYEGCYGKPGSTVRSDSRPTLRRKATTSLRFPAVVWAPGRDGQRAHAAAAVEISSQNPAVAWDLVWTMRQGGLSVSCPQRPERGSPEPAPAR